MNFLIPVGLFAVGAVVAVAGLRAARRAGSEYQLVLDETEEAIQAELKRLEQPSTAERMLNLSVDSLLKTFDEQSVGVRYEPRDVKTLPLFAMGGGR